MPNSFADVIDAFGGPAAFAREVGMTPGAAKQARRRSSISARWFGPTVDAAKRLGKPGISYSTLAALARADDAQDAA
jgi:hypothetical protein